MEILKNASRRFKALFTKETLDRELDDEMRLHMDLLAEEYERSGVPAAEAKRLARRRFGNLGRLKEKGRDIRGAGVLDDVIRDLHYAVRTLRKSPVFTMVVALSLAIGIGANTALFTVVDAAFLRKLPVEKPDELVFFRWISGPSATPFEPAIRGGNFMRFGRGSGDSNTTGFSSSLSFSPLTFEKFRANTETLSDVFAFTTLDASITTGSDTFSMVGQLVSGNYFNALGVRAERGRLITSDDDRTAATPVAVISHAFWERSFGTDPAAVGRDITLNGVPLTIIGITANDFRGVQASRPTPPDIMVPLVLGPQLKPNAAGSQAWWLMMMGRMKPGIRIEQVLGNLAGVFLGTVSVEGAQSPPRLEVLSASRGWTDSFGPATAIAQLVAILAAVSAVLLFIVCLNAASLLVARGAARQYEIGVRLAMGAGRVRLIRQLLTESVVLASVGGVLGVLLAVWGKQLLRTMLPRAFDLQINPTVLAFAAAVSLLTGILFGIAPAFRTTRMDVSAAVKQGARNAAGVRSRLAKSLVVAQVAMSVVLLMGTGLLLRTIGNWQEFDAGFDTDNLLLLSVRPQGARYDANRTAALYEQIIQRIDAISGVRSTTTSDIPLVSDGYGGVDRMTALDEQVQPGNAFVRTRYVRFNFLETIGIPLIAGRNLLPSDSDQASRVAVISESVARRFFGNGNPVGRRFTLQFSQRKPVEVVGVMKDVFVGVAEAGGVFLSGAQPGGNGALLQIRTAGDASAIVPQIRDAMREIDPSLPLSGIRTQNQEIERGSSNARTLVPVWAIFGVVALLLTCIGLYGLMAYTVARRTNEIGVRIALGARRIHVMRMVMGQMMKLVLAGLAIGLVGSIIANQTIRRTIYGVTLYDPMTILAVVVTLLIVALVAGYQPLRRASKIDPTIALRCE